MKADDAKKETFCSGLVLTVAKAAAASFDLSVLQTRPAILRVECARKMTTPVLTTAEFQLGCSLKFHLHFSVAQLALKTSL